MFFILSKTLGFFALPSNLLIMLAIAGTVLLFTPEKLRFQLAGESTQEYREDRVRGLGRQTVVPQATTKVVA